MKRVNKKRGRRVDDRRVRDDRTAAVKEGSVIVSSDIVRSQAEKRQQTQWRTSQNWGTPGRLSMRGHVRVLRVSHPRGSASALPGPPGPRQRHGVHVLTLSIEVRRDRLPQSFAMLVPMQGGRP